MAVGAVMGGGLCVAPARGADAGTPPYKDLSLPFEKRAADLVSRMTLEEKADQVLMITPPNSRLDIPPCHWWSEGLHGIARAGVATIFPEAIAMGATWDPPLVKDVAGAISDEARAKFDPDSTRYRGLMLWCPTINMARDPRWGRNEETFGEDPWLTGRIGVAYVEGIQGDDPKYLKAVATPKHFAVHSQEIGRMSRDVHLPEEIIRDYYLPAFRACFVEGHAMSTMAAHNALNGIPCTANEWLLTDILRKEWHFQGSVVSDWTGVTQMVRAHNYVPTEVDAVAAAINAGLDVMCDPRNLHDEVVQAVDSGKLSKEALDRAVLHNITLRMRLGMFDPPEKVPFKTTSATAVGSAAHRELALKCALESTVLMKNDAAPKGYGFGKLLPIDLRRVDSIAVVGPYAQVRQYGAYSAQAPAGPAPTIVESLRAAVGNRVKINTADWNDSLDKAVHAAETSTITIAVVGLNNSMEKEGIDRYTLDLPPDQRQFLEKVVAANPLTIVVLEGGAPIGVEWMKKNVPAILNVWYPGEQGGPALAQVLLGQYDPAGRLPMTYYRSIDDLPAMDDYTVVDGRTYMYTTKPVSYPFGHGLSYTTFEYRSIHAPERATAKDTIDVAVDVANTGERDGEDVVQLYVRKVRAGAASEAASEPAAPSAADPQPLEQLKAFERVAISGGNTATVHLRLAVADLGMWDSEHGEYAVAPGVYELMVGASSADIRQRARITIGS
ncbi:MAG TPA: glycoside hydrolase family 3 N-terminal domain-containing protein [Phycisphaerae bacterium]|nr:glycoside hydrolase family 3 N-terminal domain-containing protein [Phycisphaerae bacterium]